MRILKHLLFALYSLCCWQNNGTHSGSHELYASLNSTDIPVCSLVTELYNKLVVEMKQVSLPCKFEVPENKQDCSTNVCSAPMVFKNIDLKMRHLRWKQQPNPTTEHSIRSGRTARCPLHNCRLGKPTSLRQERSLETQMALAYFRKRETSRGRTVNSLLTLLYA